jgi:2-keto-3-deoxy-L-rhamnonate aldolase RhmA
MEIKTAEILFALTLVVLGVPILSAQSEWENPVKKSLREGKPVVGLTVSIPSADVVVQAASLGFDFVWIETEHSPTTLESVRNMILATKGEKLVPIVRVPVNEKWTAKRAMDAGALGVVFPFTNNVALAKQAVAACKYPPLGDRGSGPGLPTLRWPAPGGYADFADKNIMVIVIIERKEAIDQIDEIAAVPGIDVLFIGPNDLSYSYGKRGDMKDPEVLAAIAKVVAAGKKHNVPVGRTAGAADIAGFVKEGFQFFQAPSELVMMGLGARPLLDALGKQGVDPKTRPMY